MPDGEAHNLRREMCGDQKQLRLDADDTQHQVLDVV